MSWFFNKLNYSVVQNVYQLGSRDLQHHRRNPLLQLYSNSIPDILSNIYPEYDWDLNLFTQTKTSTSTPIRVNNNRATPIIPPYIHSPTTANDMKQLHRIFFDELSRKLGIPSSTNNYETELDRSGWYSVTKKQLNTFGSSGVWNILAKYNYSLMQALQSVYSEYDWKRK